MDFLNIFPHLEISGVGRRIEKIRVTGQITSKFKSRPTIKQNCQLHTVFIEFSFKIKVFFSKESTTYNIVQDPVRLPKQSYIYIYSINILFFISAMVIFGQSASVMKTTS